MQNDVFISYSSKDVNTANKILNYLESKGLKCWIAHRDISPGANYGEVLMKNIAMSKVVVLILSQHSNNSQQVIREIERAVSKRITIIPFRIEDVELSDAMEYFISTHQWIDVHKSVTNEILEKLSQTIHQVIGAVPSIDQSQTIKKENHGLLSAIIKNNKLLVVFTIVLLISLCVVVILKIIDSTPPEKSLAILPFETVDANIPLRTNFKEELKERLVRYADLRTFTSDSLILTTDKQIDIKKTLGSINARYIITGNLRNLENSIRYKIAINDLSFEPPKEIWSTSFESESFPNQKKINTISRQIHACIQIESSHLKNSLKESLFELYKYGQLWLLDDNLKSLPEAEANFRAIIRSDSTISGAFSGLGQSLIYQCLDAQNFDCLEEAKRYCQRSVFLDSNDARAYSVLGMISYLQGDENNAIELLKHSISLNPDEIPAYAMLGSIYFYKPGGIKEAKYYYLRAKQLDPAEPMNYTNLAGAYYYSRNYNEAYETLRDALKIDSTYSITWKTLGSYYERKELYDSAIVAFKNALRYNRHDDGARLDLAALQILQGDLTTARQNLYEGIQLDRHFYQLKYLYGIVCQLQGNKAEARTSWQDCIVTAEQIASTDSLAEAFMYLGLCNARLGNSQVAIYNGQKAVLLDSSEGDILSGLARIYSILKNKEETKIWLSRAKGKANDIDEAFLKTNVDFMNYVKDADILNIVRGG